MSKIRVLLADDHGVLRKGVATLLSEDPRIEVVGEADNGNQAVEMANQLRPDVVILDIAMPELNGIDAAEKISKIPHGPGIIMLSMYSDEEYLLRALSAGAKGFLLKHSAEPDLLRAVDAVAAGKPFFSPDVAAVLMADYVQRLRKDGRDDSYDLLSHREKQVLQLLAEGRTNKEVATALGLGVSTIETHRENLMQKLNLHNTAELVVYAIKKKVLRV
jgi:DNA-binding NarL/FixJ family response regulator